MSNKDCNFDEVHGYSKFPGQMEGRSQQEIVCGQCRSGLGGITEDGECAFCGKIIQADCPDLGCRYIPDYSSCICGNCGEEHPDVW